MRQLMIPKRIMWSLIASTERLQFAVRLANIPLPESAA